MEDRNDHSDAAILILVIIAFGILFLYRYKYEYFVAVWWITKYPMMTIIANIEYSILKPLLSWVFWENNYSGQIKAMANFYNSHSLSNFMDLERMDATLQEVAGMDTKKYINLVNSMLMNIYMPIILLLSSIYILKIQGKERFTTIYTPKTLGIQEATIWPPIKPVIHDYDLMTRVSPIDKKYWFCMADKPLEYFNKIGILEKFKKENDDDFEVKQEYVKLNINKLYKQNIQELGERWTSPEDLSFEEKAILAIILPKIYRRPKESKLLSDLCSTLYASYPNRESVFFSANQFKNLITLKFDKLKIIKKIKNNKERSKIIKESKRTKKKVASIIDGYINKYYYKEIKGKKKGQIKEIRPEIQKIIDNHFYKKTVFIKLLSEGRKNAGVLAACEFIWIKKVNRDFWYILSQTGRTASFPEVSSVWSHYLAEIKVGRRMAAGAVMNAIFAADKYMFNTHDNYISFNDND